MKNLSKHSKLPAASYKVILNIYCHHSTLQDLIKMAYEKPYRHYKYDEKSLTEYPDSYRIIFERAKDVDQFLLTNLKTEIDFYKTNVKELDSTFIRHLSKIDAEFLQYVEKLQKEIYAHTN